MRKWWAKPMMILTLLTLGLSFAWLTPASAAVDEQLPTVAVPTVTGTPTGPMAMVIPSGTENQANLRSGPGELFDRVGVLLLGQKVPAIGRSPKGEWVQVEYPGAPDGKAWVYAILVKIEPNTAILPIVESPPTPTVAALSTIDPTLAAKFVVTLEPTRLPTFTEPPPLAIPTFTDASTPTVSKVPMGFIILGLAVLGLFIGLIAFAQR